MTNNTIITKDLPNRKINVTRPFAATVDKVWKAFTDSTVLDQWWAPRPWRAETKTMNFTEGGYWLYCMISPEGDQKAWCKVSFHTIVPGQSFTSTANFCDEDGNINEDFPAMHWLVKFEATATGAQVVVDISFDNDADMNKIVEMGFEGGFTMALGNLDELFAA
ncbi:MAG TPA: SRPBCC domain-containing protein [Mucilaginibacter sp.]|jgi:uncharacterized protein YndB with AHSA1/START domain|nr:SRPBCC domain-containing protein [Mucilaginibacter sp.]